MSCSADRATPCRYLNHYSYLCGPSCQRLIRNMRERSRITGPKSPGNCPCRRGMSCEWRERKDGDSWWRRIYSRTKEDVYPHTVLYPWKFPQHPIYFSRGRISLARSPVIWVLPKVLSAMLRVQYEKLLLLEISLLWWIKNSMCLSLLCGSAPTISSVDRVQDAKITMCRFNDLNYLILAYRLPARLFNWSIDWLMKCGSGCLINQSINRSIDWLIDCSNNGLHFLRMPQRLIVCRYQLLLCMCCAVIVLRLSPIKQFGYIVLVQVHRKTRKTEILLRYHVIKRLNRLQT